MDSTTPSPKEESPLDALQERLGPKLEEAQERLKEVNENAKGFIRKNPGTALVGAAALGFLLGRLVSRR